MSNFTPRASNNSPKRSTNGVFPEPPTDKLPTLTTGPVRRRDRSTPTKELWVRLFTDLDELRRLIGELRPEDWERQGLHQTLGVMAMPRIFEEFLVGHLESHARQLESLLPG